MRNRFIYIALFLSVVILVWLGRIYIAKNKLQMQYTRDVEHTYRVIITLKNCEQLLTDAETSQRGYILTHLDKFRYPYDEALLKIDSAIANLKELVADNPSQRVNFKLLNPVITERLDIMHRNFDLEGTKPELVERLTKGKLLMDKIRLYIDIMEKEEYVLLQFRNKEKNHYQEVNFTFLTYTFAFACLVSLASMALIIRELRMRIRSQKMLEQSLFELNQSNDEIEQVSFAVSHDLQEPLRKIRTLGTLLVKKYGDKSSEEEKDILSRINRSTERMHGLLDNLIAFTNLINRSEKQSPVPLERPFKLAFEKVMGHTGTDLVMEQELPVIAGYEQQLVLLFTQLLSNAFQYRHADRKLVIEVTASVSDGTRVPGIIAKTGTRYRVVTIKDNGIGFDNVFRERIFVLFQRLHNQTEYTGKGIGLTIARRVMTNHYGYILASGIKGEGASFTLYFPIA